MPKRCQLHSNKYLNNIVEQDHRFMRRLVKTGLGFWFFHTAWRMLRGYEIRAHDLKEVSCAPPSAKILSPKTISLPRCWGWPEKPLEKWATFAPGPKFATEP